MFLIDLDYVLKKLVLPSSKYKRNAFKINKSACFLFNTINYPKKRKSLTVNSIISLKTSAHLTFNSQKHFPHSRLSSDDKELIHGFLSVTSQCCYFLCWVQSWSPIPQHFEQQNPDFIKRFCFKWEKTSRLSLGKQRLSASSDCNRVLQSPSLRADLETPQSPQVRAWSEEKTKITVNAYFCFTLLNF